MAESSILWTTNGTGDGINSGYTQAQMHEMFRALFAGRNTTNLGGVVQDYLNKLAVTGAASPVAIDTGAAIVYGLPYFNSASVTVAIPTPSVSTRIDYIVLRAGWVAQTVRITRVAGTEGEGAPALTQSAGVTWDIPLATASITTGGVITVTDARQWIAVMPIALRDATIIYVKTASLQTLSGLTVVVLDTNVAESDPDSILSLATNAITVAATAKYRITATVRCQRSAGSTGFTVSGYIYVDGSPSSFNAQYTTVDAVASSVGQVIINGVLSLTSGAVLTLRAQRDLGSDTIQVLGDLAVERLTY